MEKQIRNSYYTVKLCLKDSDRIDIHALSKIVDKFNDLFTCISDFVTRNDDCIEEPTKIITSIYGNQIMFTIDSDGKNLTHGYMLRTKTNLMNTKRNVMQQFDIGLGICSKLYKKLV